VSGAFFPLVPMEAGGGEEGEEGFAAPGVQSFDLPPLYEGAPEWLNKYLLMAVVSVILVMAFWLIMSRNQKLVPSKGQFIGEAAYFFIRNGIARDMIGHDFRRFLPLLIALFSFILVNNLWGVFPLTLLPTTSHVGWAYGLAAMVGSSTTESASLSTGRSAISSTRCCRPGCRCSCGRSSFRWSSSPTSSCDR
jgi:hypothetical protein